MSSGLQGLQKIPLFKMPSVDQLDQMIRVTTVFSWMVLLGAGVITVSVILWAFMGVLYQDVTVRGVYMSDSQIEKIYAKTPGNVDSILVSVGQWVEMGEPLAVVSGETVYSDYVGIVNEIFAYTGQQADGSYELMEIRKLLSGEEKIVFSYVPLRVANTINEGMKVILVPAALSEEQYGHMTGYIKGIGDFGVSEASMYQRLGDHLLVSSFIKAGNAEPMVEVMIEIDKNTNSQNGYAWSNAEGEKLSLPSLADITVRIIIDEQAPVKFLFGV